MPREPTHTETGARAKYASASAAKGVECSGHTLVLGIVTPQRIWIRWYSSSSVLGGRVILKVCVIARSAALPAGRFVRTEVATATVLAHRSAACSPGSSSSQGGLTWWMDWVGG